MSSSRVMMDRVIFRCMVEFVELGCGDCVLGGIVFEVFG